jgi:hypothetical protein
MKAIKIIIMVLMMLTILLPVVVGITLEPKNPSHLLLGYTTIITIYLICSVPYFAWKFGFWFDSKLKDKS